VETGIMYSLHQLLERITAGVQSAGTTVDKCCWRNHCADSGANTKMSQRRIELLLQ